MKYAVALFLLTGCLTTQAVPVNPLDPKCAAIQPQQVRIFASQAELDNLKIPYVTVAVLFVRGAEYATPEQVVWDVRTKAAAVGANGVVMAQASQTGQDIAIRYGECVTPRSAL